MARVFLSYDRDDAARARILALTLEKAGHSVWWDAVIKAGAQFGAEIEQALKDSDSVVVLWSRQSVDSAWVRDEAAAGRDAGKLVPVLIDQAQPPMGFRQFQSIDLSRWNGRPGSPRLQALLDAVAGPAAAPPPAKPAAVPPRRPRANWSLVAAVLALVLVVAGLAFWRLSPGSSEVPLVAVTAADPSPGSNAWARDLLVKLASLQAADADALRLVDRDGDKQPDLILEIGGLMQQVKPEASLVLRSGKDQTLLWSKDFQEPDTSLADLKQQLAHAAAQALRCAVEAMGSKGKSLDQPTLKLYLSGCSALTTVDNLTPLKPLFMEVVDKAPSFEGGWAKLLKIEASRAAFQTGAERERIRQSLRLHIADARKVNPQMAEAYLAEAALLPGAAISARMKLLDLAVQYNPEDSEALAQRSAGLLTVGRLNDALADSRHAADIDPLSPATRDQYIGVLINTGLNAVAIEELEKAERLWPGTSNLANTRFFYNLVAGDPKMALQSLESQRFEVGAAWEIYGPFLRARIDPSRANIERALATSRTVTAAHPTALTMLMQSLATFGADDELFDTLINSRPESATFITHVIFRPAFRDFWRNPRSMRIAARLGLLDYWRLSGKWPDFCSDSPYDCKAVAAKLAA